MDNSEITTIQQQFDAGLWPKFLESLTISGLRGFSGQTISFRFPISVVVGENGSGKSTVLKAAAAAYDNQIPTRKFYPSTFFLSTHWDEVKGVELQYRVRQGDTTTSFSLNKPNKRWSISVNRPKRRVYLQDISRTLPLDASAGYARVAKLSTAEISTDEIDKEFRERLCLVLGRSYARARFAVPDADKKRSVGVLEFPFGEVSQFHQGAGEDATLDLFKVLQGIPDHSLLIIDEVEASLHPRAQRRLMRVLLWLCRQKRIQVIVSSHSPYVLEELPANARVMLLPGPAGTNIVYGPSPEFALSRLDDEVKPDLFLFVEDREAEIFLREILASSSVGRDYIPRLSISAVGAGNVVQMMGSLGKNNKLPYRSLAFLDGDFPASEGCIVLPGSVAPERVVYSGLKNAGWKNLPERFGVGAGDLLTFLEDAMLDQDHHNWNRRVGDRVIKSKVSVWEILVGEWCKHCLSDEERDRIVNAVGEALEK